MLDRIKEIRFALSNKQYYSALALSLTLPDMCGKIEYPNKDNGKKRYIDWYNQYLRKRFTCEGTKLPGGEKIEYTWMTAEELYALRCAFLHAGNFEVEKIALSKVRLHAHVRNGENYSHIIRDGNYVDWDVIEICKCICDSVEEYWLEKIDKNLMIDEIRIDTW